VAPLPPVPTVDVIEFHHPPSGQYFLTADTAEAALLEGGGLGPDWRRTGATFQAYPRDAQAPVEARDACRFFGTPGLGPNSHFYTTDAAECAAVGADPHWTREGVAFREGAVHAEKRRAQSRGEPDLGEVAHRPAGPLSPSGRPAGPR